MSLSLLHLPLKPAHMKSVRHEMGSPLSLIAVSAICAGSDRCTRKSGLWLSGRSVSSPSPASGTRPSSRSDASLRKFTCREASHRRSSDRESCDKRTPALASLLSVFGRLSLPSSESAETAQYVQPAAALPHEQVLNVFRW